MIITKNWLQECIDISQYTADDICKTLNSIGLEVDSLTSYRMPDKCVIGYVTSKQKHPDADKLSVCTVDVGEDAPLQIVCGAPNVDEKQYVPIALNGAVLPNGLTIKKATLRGVESNGMICSSTELGLPKINDGIMVLNSIMEKYKVGMPLRDIKEINDDVIEVELTANRGDCLSIHGVARDLSAALNLKLGSLITPEDDVSQIGIGRVLNIIVEGKIDSSVEYKVVDILKLNEDLLVELRLAMIGIKEETLIDKYLSYSSHATGVILRAYNKEAFNKSKDDKINIVLKKDTNKLDALWSDNVLSYVGISQDNESKAKDEDKSIIIEASYTDPEYIASNGARNIKGADNALYQSIRGSEPEISMGLVYLEELLNKTSKIGVLTGSQRHIREKETIKISVNFDDMFGVIGKEIPRNEVIDILNKLGFKTMFNPEQNSIWIDVPAFRHDITNMQDICEEIVRVVGIDNIPSKPLKFTEKNRINKISIDFEKKKLYRHKAAAAGFYECVHYIFDDRDRIEKYGFVCIDKEKDILNPITTELNTLRVNLSLNLLESVSKNINMSKKSVCLFEVGRVFDKNREEKTNISFVASGLTNEPSVLNHGKPQEFTFFTFVQKVKQAIGEFDIRKASPENTLFSPYEYGEVVEDNEVLGVIGRVNTQNDFNLSKAYVCELDFEKLTYKRKNATAYSKLPSVSRDLSLVVDKNLEFSKISDCIKSLGIDELSSFYAIDIYSDESLKSDVSLTITLNFQPKEKSFSDEEINNMVGKVLENLDNKLGINIR